LSMHERFNPPLSLWERCHVLMTERAYVFYSLSPTLSRVRGEGALFIFLLRHRQGVSEELRRDAIYRVSSIAKFLDAINRVST